MFQPSSLPTVTGHTISIKQRTHDLFDVEMTDRAGEVVATVPMTSDELAELRRDMVEVVA